MITGSFLVALLGDGERINIDSLPVSCRYASLLASPQNCVSIWLGPSNQGFLTCHHRSWFFFGSGKAPRVLSRTLSSSSEVSFIPTVDYLLVEVLPVLSHLASILDYLLFFSSLFYVVLSFVHLSGRTSWSSGSQGYASALLRGWLQYLSTSIHLLADIPTRCAIGDLDLYLAF